VLTDIPSNREWVTENFNGWLAPVNSAEGFANQLLRAARLTPEQRRLFSERNRRIVKERADWDRNFPRLLEMYERITAKAIARS
jgi:glycosyltransferase involved in cell wall biosynthesis